MLTYKHKVTFKAFVRFVKLKYNPAFELQQANYCAWWDMMPPHTA